MKPFIGTTRVLVGFPAVYATWRQEVCRPFRRSERVCVVRIPWTRRGLVFGYWQGRLPDEDAALAALGHRLTPYLEKDKERGDGVD